MKEQKKSVIEIDPDYLNFVVTTEFSSSSDAVESALIEYEIEIYGSPKDDLLYEEEDDRDPLLKEYLASPVGETDGESLLIGRAMAFSGVFEKYSVLPEEVLDLHPATVEYAELYEEYSYSDDVGEATETDEYGWNSNILIIDRIEILPFFRGQNLGLRSLIELSRKLKIAAPLVAIKPFPVQYHKKDGHSHPYWGEKWSEAMQYPHYKNEIQWKKDKRKLGKYYEKANFHPIRKGYFMITDDSKPV